MCQAQSPSFSGEEKIQLTKMQPDTKKICDSTRKKSDCIRFYFLVQQNQVLTKCRNNTNTEAVACSSSGRVRCDTPYGKYALYGISYTVCLLRL